MNDISTDNKIKDGQIYFDSVCNDLDIILEEKNKYTHKKFKLIRNKIISNKIRRVRIRTEPKTWLRKMFITKAQYDYIRIA